MLPRTGVAPRPARDLPRIARFGLLGLLPLGAVVLSLLSSAALAKTTSTPVTPTTVAVGQIVMSSATNQTIGLPASSLNVAALPLGTDKSSSTPRVGYLERCGGSPSGGPPVKTRRGSTARAAPGTRRPKMRMPAMSPSIRP